MINDIINTENKMKNKKVFLYLSFILTITIAISFFNNGSDYYWHLKIGN